ncbi:MAG: hypothetical protein ABIG44_02420 [Planctomycetota bacterium]
MQRYRKLCRALSYGVITVGILQAFEMLNFSEIITSFLITILSVFVSLLFGADVSQFTT